MPEKGPRAEDDNPDSDDSMDGKRPDFFAKERERPDFLLKNSNKFVRLYEEHQPELQQIIDQLHENTDRFLDNYSKATQTSKTGKLATMAGAGLALLMVPFTGGTSLAVAGGLAAVGGVTYYRGTRNKQDEEKKVLEEVEKVLKKFNTTVATVTSHLQNICNNVEKILQYQDDKQSSWIKSEIEELRKHEFALLQLSQLFKSEDLQRLLKQGMRTIDRAKNINPKVSATLFIFGFLFVFEDYRTLRDVEKLKSQFQVQEAELESKAGKFICKMRETIMHLQDTLDEMAASKEEVKRVIIDKLNQYFNQQRAETD